MNHSMFMQRALELAARGKGSVSPNPCVGCVLVKDGKIIAEGYHAAYGGPHAEAVALKKAGNRAKGATAYVTLEPCSHWGKTPPCSNALVSAGVKKVYAAIKDPNPIVSGRGFALLRKQRVSVNVGLEEEAVRLQNRSFITYMTEKRPHVVLKMAMTLDGKIAAHNGQSRWISGESSRSLVHKLRAESDAVLVGATTAIRDNPALTSHGAGRNPLRVVIDSKRRVPKSHRVFKNDEADTLVLASATKKSLKAKDILRTLARREISQLLVEGGGETAWTFVKEKLVDEIYFFIAPVLIGGRTAPTPVGGEGFDKIAQGLRFKHMSVTRLGEDILVHARRN